MMDITKSHVSVSIHSLCKKGFLFEEYRNNNRRTIHLNVTENADKIVNEGRNVQLHFREILLGGFSEYEKGLFFEYMERMDRNISTQLKSMEIKKQSERGKRVE